MPDRDPTPALEAEPTERRHAADRRAEPEASRRRRASGVWSHRLIVAGRDLLLIVVTVSAIVFAVRHERPIYANQPSVVQRLTTRVPATRAVLAPQPADTSKAALVTASPEFEHDRRAFAADLVATGRMDQARADSIAYYAVRESYLNGIPPAVVFGVMLTENALFVSGAMSNVGAVGLMQVYPKIWLKELSAKFGKDLATDSTNLKYGIYILGRYIKSDSGAVSKKAVSSGLLHYNGCVRGTNTPNCKTYPSKVKTYVEKQANAICGDKSFYECIAKPFIAGLFGKNEETPTSQ
jgi:transglycosylase-like protein with SLT domain